LHARAIHQALREANDLDRIAAMFLLGCYHQLGEEAQRWAESILHPFRESPDLLERGASAIPFAWRNERHVLPVLRTFLTESLSPQHPSPVAKPHVVLALCDDWRIDVVRLLGQWQIPSLLPVFCEVWLALVSLLEQQALLPRSQRGRHQKYLFDCIDQIAFALGQLDAFAVLDDCPSLRRRRRMHSSTWPVDISGSTIPINGGSSLRQIFISKPIMILQPQWFVC
jgi:hypothetical protein